MRMSPSASCVLSSVRWRLDLRAEMMRWQSWVNSDVGFALPALTPHEEINVHIASTADLIRDCHLGRRSTSVREHYSINLTVLT